MSFWPEDVAGRIADVAGVLGLGLTGLLTGGALRERNRLLRLIFLPRRAADVKVQCDRLGTLLGNVGKPQEIALAVGETRSVLNALKPFLEKPARRDLEAVLILLDTYNQNRTEANLDRLMTEMYRISKDASHLSEELGY